jgi:hypothetical protein
MSGEMASQPKWAQRFNTVFSAEMPQLLESLPNKPDRTNCNLRLDCYSVG